MIDTSNDVFRALQLLDSATMSEKPLMFWIGSGMSAWCGYPVWRELALKLHEEYVATEPTYDRDAGAALLINGAYPKLFSLYKTVSSSHYIRVLKREFEPRPVTPVYRRFISVLQRFSPLRIVTTNVDECLEQHLANSTIVQRSDLAHAIDLQQESKCYIAKLHGTISAVGTTVFTEEDYEALIADESYLTVLKQLFSLVSLVVAGSSMNDEYVLSLLQENIHVKGIFGDGPHFVIAPSLHVDLPKSFRLLKYNATSTIGHKTTIQILESVAPTGGSTQAPNESRTDLESAYFTIDLFPPNIPWMTGMRTRFERSPGTTLTSMIRGLGFTRDEMPLYPTTLHDVLVALTCFEKLYAPFETIPKFAYLLGGRLFEQLVSERSLEFVWWDAEEGISLNRDDNVTGGLSSFVIRSPQGKPLTLAEKLATTGNLVFESHAHAKSFTKLVAGATTCFREGMDTPIGAAIQASLSLPNVRRLLGFSRFTPAKIVPTWLAHPVLRMARLIRTAETCRIVRASSIKFPFGAKVLADALFATESGNESAASVANYVLHGSFQSSIPSDATSYRNLVERILKFRRTGAAERERKMILRHLARNEASDCVAAIDAALRQAIPTGVMQEAREQFSEFMSPAQGGGQAPSVWREAIGDPLPHWRAKARRLLMDYCRAHNIQADALCPCGSTISIQKCCLAALEGVEGT